ncbi:MAG: hypothetical protein ACREQA_11210 [Candidatus Binatia bacterium]
MAGDESGLPITGRKLKKFDWGVGNNFHVDKPKFHSKFDALLQVLSSFFCRKIRAKIFLLTTSHIKKLLKMSE